MNKKLKRFIPLMIVGTIQLAAMIGCSYLLGGYKRESFSTDLNEYLKIDGAIASEGYPKIGIFPKNLDNVKNVVDYHLYGKNVGKLFSPVWEIVLIAEFDEMNFNLEVEKLRNYSYYHNDKNLDSNYVLFNYDNISIIIIILM